MTTKRRVEIEIETERLTIRRSTNAGRFLLCMFCKEEVEVIEASQAALLCGCSLRQFISQLETSGLHFIKQVDGLPRICLNSLLKAIEQEQIIKVTEHRCETEVLSGEAINLLKE